MIANKIYAIIPARAGSKSIPDKNIQLLDGKPLLSYSIESAKAISEIDRIIVSTNSKKYAEIAIRFGAEALFLRPIEISGDDSLDIEWIVHLLTWLQNNEDELPEYLVHLRPTSPLRDSKYIVEAINFIKKHPEATALRSVVKMSQSIYKHFEVENGFLKSAGFGSFDLDLANKPRHLYPATYDANGYVDILRTSYILEYHKIHGNRVIPFYVPYITDIDRMGDLEYLKYQIQKERI